VQTRIKKSFFVKTFFSLISLLLINASCLAFDFDTVQEGVFYRCQNASKESLNDLVVTYNVKTVINLQSSKQKKDSPKEQKMLLGDDDPSDEKETPEIGKVVYKTMVMQGGDLPSRSSLVKLFNSYRRNKKPILVHSSSRSSHGALAAVLWVLGVMKKSKSEAVALFNPRLSRFRAPCGVLFLIGIWRGEEWLKKQYTPGDHRRAFEEYRCADCAAKYCIRRFCRCCSCCGAIAYLHNCHCCSICNLSAYWKHILDAARVE
jgi:hypothetical protein